MTREGWLATVSRPLLLPLPGRVRRQLLTLIRQMGKQPFDLLDVGGRKSPYTVGVPARVLIADLPRETEIQRDLHLGLTEDIINQLPSRRSNARHLIATCFKGELMVVAR